MFALLGRFVTRAWPFLLLGWLLLLGGLWLAAPPWEEAAEESRFTFLPEGSLSRHGEELFRQAFPDEVFGSSIVLVVARPSDSRGLQDPDRTFLEQVLLPALHQIASSSGSQGTSSIVARIRTFTDPGTGALLVSPDHQVTLILVDLKTAIRDRGNGPLIDKIDHLVEQLRRENQTPAGLEITLTGSAVLGHDWEREEIRGAQQSQNWTIALVVVLLVLLYRAPLLTLIPLATVFLSVEISLKLLALLASRGLITFFRDIWIYITVLTYGAGVDYCLFLIARYREEWHQGGDFRQALARAIGKVGGALSASAATVMAGIGMMGLARLSEIREAGITIPISLAVVLAGALTFTPALLCLTRQWAFWPQSPVDQATPRRGWLSSRSRLGRLLRGDLLPNLWAHVGTVLVRRPAVVWLASLGLLAPFAVLAILKYDQLNYDPLRGLPEDAPSLAGSRIIQQHFPPGMTSPLTLLVNNPGVRFDRPEGSRLIRKLTENLLQHREEWQIADVRSLTSPLGTTPRAHEALAGLPFSAKLLQPIVHQRSLEYYVSHAGDLQGHVTRLDLVLRVDPLSRHGLEALDRLVEVLPGQLPPGLSTGTDLAFRGSTVSLRDLAAVTRSDQWHLQILTPAAVLVILLFLVRRLVSSLYLVLSVLVSYLATLGATFLIFEWWYGAEFPGIDWTVPLFLLTLLVAVGEDYNIFLVARIREEQEQHGPIGGIPAGLARTGRIISGCGFIMAGTFGSLAAASVVSMKELGFALAFGVLLDTLLVRPILVPSFLILLEKARGRLLGRSTASVEQADSVYGRSQA